MINDPGRADRIENQLQFQINRRLGLWLVAHAPRPSSLSSSVAVPVPVPCLSLHPPPPPPSSLLPSLHVHQASIDSPGLAVLQAPTRARPTLAILLLDPGPPSTPLHSTPLHPLHCSICNHPPVSPHPSTHPPTALPPPTSTSTSTSTSLLVPTPSFCSCSVAHDPPRRHSRCPVPRTFRMCAGLPGNLTTAL